jgi:hypothetical protein
VQKPVLSLRLDSELLAAIDQVALQACRTQVVTAILEIFVTQDFAEQRRQLQEVLFTRRRPTWTDRWPAHRGDALVESKGKPAHTHVHGSPAQTTVAAAESRQDDLSGSDPTEAGDSVALHLPRNQAGG